jgi:hypothetical protein
MCTARNCNNRIDAVVHQGQVSMVRFAVFSALSDDEKIILQRSIACDQA